MTLSQKFDKVLTGFITGLIFPCIIGLIIYFFSHGQQNFLSYLSRVANSNIIIHSITLYVFPNILFFLLFNQLDMLRASRGVLTITIVWAVAVFAIKFLL
jgi:hypothetical protein